MSRSLPGGWFESGHGSVVVFVKDFRDPLERKKKLILRPWASIKDVKDQLQVVFNVPSNAQKLFYQGRELKNPHNLQECGIYQDNAVVDFVARRHQNLAMAYVRDESERERGHSGGGPLPVGGDALKSSADGLKKGSSRANVKASDNLRPEQMPAISIHPFGAHLLPMSLMKITHQVSRGALEAVERSLTSVYFHAGATRSRVGASASSRDGRDGRHVFFQGPDASQCWVFQTAGRRAVWAEQSARFGRRAGTGMGTECRYHVVRFVADVVLVGHTERTTKRDSVGRGVRARTSGLSFGQGQTNLLLNIQGREWSPHSAVSRLGSLCRRASNVTGRVAPPGVPVPRRQPAAVQDGFFARVRPPR